MKVQNERKMKMYRSDDEQIPKWLIVIAVSISVLVGFAFVLSL